MSVMWSCGAWLLAFDYGVLPRGVGGGYGLCEVKLDACMSPSVFCGNLPLILISCANAEKSVSEEDDEHDDGGAFAFFGVDSDDY